VGPARPDNDPAKARWTSALSIFFMPGMASRDRPDAALSGWFSSSIMRLGSTSCASQHQGAIGAGQLRLSGRRAAERYCP
jgi:hypothetical protein